MQKQDAENVHASLEYKIKSMLRQLGYDKIYRKENGLLMAEGKDGDRMISSDLPSNFFCEIQNGEILNLRQPANFQRYLYYRRTDEEQAVDDSETIKSLISMKTGEKPVESSHIGEWCMGCLIAQVRTERDSENGWHLVAEFCRRRSCYGCQNLTDAENNLSYLRQRMRELSTVSIVNGGFAHGISWSCSSSFSDGYKRPFTVPEYSSKRLVINSEEVPLDETFFDFVKSSLDDFLPNLEPEFFDESQEEFSPWMYITSFG